MRTISPTTLVFIAWALSPPTVFAQQDLALDKYTCSQFLEDSQTSAAVPKTIKFLMMTSWATGFAAAFQISTARADLPAMQVIATVLGEECRTSPDQTVVQGVIHAINQITAASQPVDAEERQADVRPAEPKQSSEIEKLPHLGTPIRQGLFNNYNNYDISGGDFRTIKNTALPACVSACKSTNRCQAFSFDKWNKWCFLKNKVGALVFEPSSILGARSGSLIVQSKSALMVDARHNKAFYGTELTMKQSVDFDECKQSCSDDDRCMAFSIVNASGKCRLFSDPQGFHTEVGTDSGVKHQTE